MNGTWIAIAASGSVEEVPVPDQLISDALRTLLGDRMTEAVDIARGLFVVVADDYDKRGLAVNTVANLTASLVGAGPQQLLCGDVVLAATLGGDGLTGAALDRARTAVSTATTLRPGQAAPGQYQLPSAADSRLLVRFGWDRRTRSFFVWVGDPDPARDQSECVVWAGAADGEIKTLAQLTARAEGHLEITPMVARLLRYDRAVAEHGGPTLLQRLGEAEREQLDRCRGGG